MPYMLLILNTMRHCRLFYLAGVYGDDRGGEQSTSVHSLLLPAAGNRDAATSHGLADADAIAK